jgi:hypothetical protein
MRRVSRGTVAQNCGSFRENPPNSGGSGHRAMEPPAAAFDFLSRIGRWTEDFAHSILSFIIVAVSDEKAFPLALFMEERCNGGDLGV